MTEPGVVLVVDDQAPNRRLLEAVLEPRGYRVVSAESGEEALRLLAEDPPDVVLLDIVMPGIDGYEVCRRIRENERPRRGPTTSSPSPSTVPSCWRE